jgi:hypothetical protein
VYDSIIVKIILVEKGKIKGWAWLWSKTAGPRGWISLSPNQGRWPVKAALWSQVRAALGAASGCRRDMIFI